jgi:hypothetical protein
MHGPSLPSRRYPWYSFLSEAESTLGPYIEHTTLYYLLLLYNCRSQWPRGLRRGSTAVRLLGLWVGIPLGHGCLSLVGAVCCQVEVSASGWSLVQRMWCVYKRVWSWRFDNDGVLAHEGLSRHCEKNYYIINILPQSLLNSIHSIYNFKNFMPEAAYLFYIYISIYL